MASKKVPVSGSVSSRHNRRREDGRLDCIVRELGELGETVRNLALLLGGFMGNAREELAAIRTELEGITTTLEGLGTGGEGGDGITGAEVREILQPAIDRLAVLAGSGVGDPGDPNINPATGLGWDAIDPTTGLLFVDPATGLPYVDPRLTPAQARARAARQTAAAAVASRRGVPARVAPVNLSDPRTFKS